MHINYSWNFHQNIFTLTIFFIVLNAAIEFVLIYRPHPVVTPAYKRLAGRPQQHKWNSKLFVIFPAENTAAHSLHFNIFLWTEVLSSRRYVKEAFC